MFVCFFSLCRAELTVAVDRERRQTLIMAELSSQVADLTQQLTRLLSDKDGLAEQMTKLQNEVQEVMGRLTTTQSAKEALEGQVNTLTTELQATKATLAEYKTREEQWQQNMKQNQDDAEQRRLQTLVDQLQQVNLLLDHDNRKYEEFVTKQRTELTNMQEEALKLKERIVAAESERNKLTAEPEDLVKNNPEVAKLQTMLLASDKMAQMLQKQLADTQAQLMLQQKENSELRIALSVTENKT